MGTVLKTLKFVAAGWPTRIIAALLAIGVGQIVYIVALISVIGIPIALALLAFPALASLYAASELGHQLSRLFRFGSAKPVSRRAVAALALAASFAVAQVVNLNLSASARALTAGDFDNRDAAPLGKLALSGSALRQREGSPDCDSLCLRLLISGVVEEVILTGAIDPASGPAPDAPGIAAKFERRGVCARRFQFPKTAERLAALSKQAVADYAAYEEARRRQDGGHCLIETPVRLAAADTVLAEMETVEGVSAYRAGFDLRADTRNATQMSLYRRTGGTYRETARRTIVRYGSLLPVTAPTYVHGYGMDLKLGFARWTSYLNSTGRQYGTAAKAAFIAEVMGLELDLAAGLEP